MTNGFVRDCTGVFGYGHGGEGVFVSRRVLRFVLVFIVKQTKTMIFDDVFNPALFEQTWCGNDTFIFRAVFPSNAIFTMSWSPRLPRFCNFHCLEKNDILFVQHVFGPKVSAAYIEVGRETTMLMRNRRTQTPDL